MLLLSILNEVNSFEVRYLQTALSLSADTEFYNI